MDLLKRPATKNVSCTEPFPLLFLPSLAPIAPRSTGISLYYQMSEESLKGFTKDRKGNDFLVNLIDSPGGFGAGVVFVG